MSSTSSEASTTPINSPEPAIDAAKWEDCTACRLTGAATFTGIGSYAIYKGYNQGAFAKIRPRGAPRTAQMTVVAGVVLIGLGLGRLAI